MLKRIIGGELKHTIRGDYNLMTAKDVESLMGGDSFMGGLIYGLLHYQDDKRALEFATAASCLKHTIKGDYNLMIVKYVKSLMGGDISGRVKR